MTFTLKTPVGTTSLPMAADVGDDDENETECEEVAATVLGIKNRSIEYSVPCALCAQRGNKCVGEPKMTCFECRTAHRTCNKRVVEPRKRQKPCALCKMRGYECIGEPNRTCFACQKEHQLCHPPKKKKAENLVTRKIEKAPSQPSLGSQLSRSTEIVSQPSKSFLDRKRKSGERVSSDEENVEGNSSGDSECASVPPRKWMKRESDEKGAVLERMRSRSKSKRTVDQLAEMMVHRKALVAELERVEARLEALTDKLSRDLT